MKKWKCKYSVKVLSGGYIPPISVPYEHSSDDLEELITWAQALAFGGGIEEIKVFNSNDESDIRYRWPSN